MSDNPKFEPVYLLNSYIGYKSHLLFQDRAGNIWFAVGAGLFEVIGDKVISHGIVSVERDFGIFDGLQDKQGRFLILSHQEGLFEYLPPTNERPTASWRRLLADLQNTTNFRLLMQDNQGTVWFGGWGGLFKFENEQTYKTAAHELDISIHTVSFHLRNIYAKLHVHSKTEAVAKALREGLV